MGPQARGHRKGRKGGLRSPCGVWVEEVAVDGVAGGLVRVGA